MGRRGNMRRSVFSSPARRTLGQLNSTGQVTASYCELTYPLRLRCGSASKGSWQSETRCSEALWKLTVTIINSTIPTASAIFISVIATITTTSTIVTIMITIITTIITSWLHEHMPNFCASAFPCSCA